MLALFPGTVSGKCFLLNARHLPRAPLPAQGVTSCSVVFNTPSERVTPPSSLILAHAPDQIPPADFDLTITTGLCRSLRVTAGRWPFPTLSLQSLRRCLDPYPVAPLQCICSLLPKGLRPHLRRHKFGAPNYPDNATSTGLQFSGLQSFANVQAPTLDRPPGCTHR